MDLFHPPDHLNYGSPPKHPKISKIRFRNVFGSDLGVFGYPWGITFLYISWLPENYYFARRIMRNASFCFPNPLICWLNFNTTLICFKVSFLDTVSIICPIWHPKTRFRYPARSKMASKICQVSPPRLGGVCLSTFLCQRMATYSIPFDDLYQKYIPRG